MGRVIHTIAVPEESVCNAILKKWRAEGVNISARVCMLIEEQNHLSEKIGHLQNKLSYLKYMTMNKWLAAEDWREIFEGIEMYSPYKSGDYEREVHVNQQRLNVGEEE